ncbi:hypothetical protein [Priestia flexa]|uniref:hypothetical protein n=1 Tax=Priestia flexa TaxID=86664 RepID=UPI003CFDB9DC
MALKRFCPKCKVLIDAGNRYCASCSDKVVQQQAERMKQRKEQGKDKERHKAYKAKRTDEREQRFYSSKQWELMKLTIINKYKGMCIYTYYKEDRIVPYDTIHHIIPVKDDWNMRLHLYNLIPVTESVHQKLHKMYKHDKEQAQKELKELIAKWNGWN